MRIKTLHIFFIIVFILLGIFLFYLQIVKGPEYEKLSHRNSIRLLSIDAPRGFIYDRNGRIITDNELAFGVYIVPQEARDLDAEIKKLSVILDIPASLLKRNYKRNYQAPFAPCELTKGISKRQAIIIEESRLDIPGALVKEYPLRRYLYKDATAHVTGYVGKIDESETKMLKEYGYSARGFIGKDGVEKAVDGFLRGKNGGMQVQVDNRGRQVRILNIKRPEKGKDVYLTIDAELQKFLWKGMKDKKGAAVFMDVHTGEILAMVSSPSYDPNFSISKILYDKDAPLLNRGFMGHYPPGSIFKIVVAMAGLESGKIDENTSFICQGRLNVGRGLFHCWNRDGHGVMNIRKAIVESCNVFFYNVGLLIGADEIYDYARRFGLGKKTGVDLGGEIEGFVPSRRWKKSKMGQNWYAGDTANFSIGQGYLLVTPLQIARMIAAMANGGKLVDPHVLKKLEGRPFATYRETDLKFEEKNIDIIRKAMRGVVDEYEGTGFRAWSDIVNISAKTGTSQAGGGRNTHAWFGGFAPSEDPEISFVVFLEHGGSGGAVAAMIAKKAIEYWYKNKSADN